ncbi:MAG: hypothetical protein C0596_16555 [Marinilabiliales bacterium]|nr:MAG: hypothetical protein C0596_16555 [Marinilabiliales bacterium]
MLSLFQAITFDTSKIYANAMTVFLIGFSVVFAALISIYLFFYFLPRIISFEKKEKKGKKVKETKVDVTKEEKIQGNKEIYAAIAMALHMHFEDMHDEESMVLTMDIKERAGTQWSSKIININ